MPGLGFLRDLTRPAQAHVRIGAIPDEIRELLSRNLADHGQVQGLPSKFLVAELQRMGTPLPYSEARSRFVAISEHLSRALALAPDGPDAAEAAVRLLQGEFYDSFDTDPLASTQTWPQLRSQIALAESLARGELGPEAREETEFIAAILYTRAARYPQSLRVAVMPLLREALGKP